MENNETNFINRMKRLEIREQKRNIKRARRYRRVNGLSDNAIVVLFPDKNK